MQFYWKMFFALCYEHIFVVLLILCVLISLLAWAAVTLLIQLLHIVFSLQLDINV